jgi:hypothetical protein
VGGRGNRQSWIASLSGGSPTLIQIHGPDTEPYPRRSVPPLDEAATVDLSTERRKHRLNLAIGQAAELGQYVY